MASNSGRGCETKVINIPKQLHVDSGKVALRSAIHLVSLELETTLVCSGLLQIKGVAEWNSQICVATDRFLVFFVDSFNDSNAFKHDVDMALPPEIGHVVTITTGSEPESLYILSDWVWTLSWKHELTRFIGAPNMSSISVSQTGQVLLAGNASLTMYDKDGAMLKQFSMPYESDFENMNICQAELTGAGIIVVSICGKDKNRLLTMNDDGIVERLYDSPIQHHNVESGNEWGYDLSGCMTCAGFSNRFIASHDGNRFFVAETYPGSRPSCQLCQEKIMILDKDFHLNQIILPGPMTPHFKNYSRICCSVNRLIVVCMKVDYKDDASLKVQNEILTPVVNVYRVGECRSR